MSAISLTPTESFCDKIARQLLVFRRNTVPLRSLEQAITDAGDEETLIRTLVGDSKGRFNVFVVEGETQVSRNVLPQEHELAEALESWRSTIVAYLAEKRPVELSIIGNCCPRPSNVPQDIKLKDVVLSDPRFQVSGEGSEIRAKLRLCESEVQ